MPAALSEDLRWRIIKAWQKTEPTAVELAEQFCVGEATVKRLKRTFRDTKNVKRKPRGGGTPRIITPEQESIVEALVQQYPDWSEDMYAEYLVEHHEIRASAVTVGRTIRRLGYSVKKSPSSRRNATSPTLSKDESSTRRQSKTSPLRVWFLWTKPARTRR
jgi:transposase